LLPSLISFTRLQRRYRRYRAHRQYAAGSPVDAIFVWIPKTAGTFFYRHLAVTAGAPKLKAVGRIKPQRLSGVVTFGHMHLPTLLAAGTVTRDFYDKAFVFTFVRNPYTRAVSNYEYQKQQGRLPPEMSFETFCLLLAKDGVAPVGDYNFNSLSQCNPQMEWLRGLRVDYIGRVEDMEASAGEICRRLGIPAPPDSNVKPNRSVFRDYNSYLTPASIGWVNDYYREDFEQLGYEMLSGGATGGH
jgi:hypothetical protein